MSRCAILIFAAALASACTSTGVVGGNSTGTNGASGSSGSGALPTCGDCFSDANCQSGICAQLVAGDGSCLVGCGSGCPSGSFCQTLPDLNGNEQSACVPQSGACGDPSTGKCPAGCSAGSHCDLNSGSCVPDSSSGATSTSTGGTTSTSSTSGSGDCGTYAAPNTPASCSCSGTDCTANGCYGGWYCDTETNHCVSPQTACGSGAGTTTSSTGTTGTSGNTTSTGSTTAGAPWTGQVTKTGGTVSRLYFTAVGDCRPPNEDETSAYPTAIIQKIFSDMNALSVKPEFVVATGDYMYANPTKSTGATQIQDFLSAASGFPGVLFPAMGNHECTGYTDSNCSATGYTDSHTTSNSPSHNYLDFMNSMMTPLGQSKPYYRFDISASDGSWKAKFLVLAMNAWDSTQSSWLSTQLQSSTDYTFVIRHEPDDATTAPGVTPSDQILASDPHVIKLVGHTHEFYHQSGSREVIIGNGGAPITASGQTYGYGLVQVLANGSVEVDNYDYQSNAPVDTVIIPK